MGFIITSLVGVILMVFSRALADITGIPMPIIFAFLAVSIWQIFKWLTNRIKKRH